LLRENAETVLILEASGRKVSEGIAKESNKGCGVGRLDIFKNKVKRANGLTKVDLSLFLSISQSLLLSLSLSLSIGKLVLKAALFLGQTASLTM